LWTQSTRVAGWGKGSPTVTPRREGGGAALLA
jgi:hypothetical protein